MPFEKDISGNLHYVPQVESKDILDFYKKKDSLYDLEISIPESLKPKPLSLHTNFTRPEPPHIDFTPLPTREPIPIPRIERNYHIDDYRHDPYHPPAGYGQDRFMHPTAYPMSGIVAPAPEGWPGNP